MDLAEEIASLGRRAKAAAARLAPLDDARKRAGLEAAAEAVADRRETILAANARDLEAADAAALPAAARDRLRLDGGRLDGVVAAIRAVAALPDPVGEVIRAWSRPNGLAISKVRVPIGVVGIIYESRPNVTSDAAALCVKTGNAALLRGGSEALRSNLALGEAFREGLHRAGLPADAVLLVPRPEREAVALLAAADQFVDLIVPRGGKALIETVRRHARVPVIKHDQGLCVLYVDDAADLAMATRLAVNAKCQRPGVCNAVETLLVARAVAAEFLPRVAAALWAEGVALRGDETTRALLGADRVAAATPEDWDTEYLDRILAVAVVDDLDAALAHVARHGSHHSDAIVTDDPARAERFLREVDSAAVYWNASTRFTDGAEFGFGAEIGISTDKLHARGPMGLEELTTYKYVVRGHGQTRD